MVETIVFHDPLPPHDPLDVRPGKFCVRCPAEWEPDDQVCWACGAEKSIGDREKVLDREGLISVS